MVFARDGVARASMSNLALETGISKATIYHYYASKDLLLFDILDTYLRTLRDRLFGLDLTATSPEAGFETLVTEVLLAYCCMDHEHKIQGEGISLLARDQQNTLRAYQRDVVALMSDQIAACAPHVFQNAPQKRRATAMSVFGMLNWFYMWHANADEPARKDYARLVTNLTLGGLNAL